MYGLSETEPIANQLSKTEKRVRRGQYSCPPTGGRWVYLLQLLSSQGKQSLT